MDQELFQGAVTLSREREPLGFRIFGVVGADVVVAAGEAFKRPV